MQIKLNLDSLILAAGESNRMGEDKALLSINKQSFLEQIIHKVSVFSDNIIVVTGQNHESVQKWISQFSIFKQKCTILFNQDHKLGMFSSIRKGLQKVDPHKYVLLQMVDQPFIPQEIYWKLLKNIEDKYYVIQPAHKVEENIRWGHPLILSPQFLKVVLTSDLKKNLNEIIRNYSHKRKAVMVKTDLIFHNINTPQDLENIKKRLNYGNPT